MKPERSYYNQPIRSLQTMLRTIALFNDEFQRIIPDGIYGPETQAAIRTFQRNRGLPITGTTNQQTWDEVVRMYDAAQVELSPARFIDDHLPSEFPFTRGDRAPRLKLAQCMLCEIGDRYSCICTPEISGQMDEMMMNSIMEFQNLSALPVTGILDKTTWNHLVLQYALAQVFAKRQKG